MAAPSFAAGQKVLASTLQMLVPAFAYKTVDQNTGANNTTLQNDTHLAVGGIAGAVYLVDTHFEIQGAGSAAAGNMKFAWTFPAGAGCQLTWSGAGMAVNDIAGATTEGKGSWLSTLSTTSPSTPSIVFGTPSANWAGVGGRGLWIVGGTAGTLQLQWAQSVNSATASTIRTGSYINLTRVS